MTYTEELFRRQYERGGSYSWIISLDHDYHEVSHEIAVQERESAPLPVIQGRDCWNFWRNMFPITMAVHVDIYHSRSLEHPLWKRITNCSNKASSTIKQHCVKMRLATKFWHWHLLTGWRGNHRMLGKGYKMESTGLICFESIKRGASMSLEIYRNC